MSPGTNRMNRGPSKRSGELLSRTRDHRARLLPTKHRLAALPPATREYQSDSSSKRPGAVVLFPLPPENSPPKSAALDAGSLHIRRGKDRRHQAGFRNRLRGLPGHREEPLGVRPPQASPLLCLSPLRALAFVFSQSTPGDPHPFDDWRRRRSPILTHALDKRGTKV